MLSTKSHYRASGETISRNESKELSFNASEKPPSQREECPPMIGRYLKETTKEAPFNGLHFLRSTGKTTKKVPL